MHVLERFFKGYGDHLYFIFRVLVGFGFFQHGTQKLLGWWGGVNGGTVPLMSMFGAAGVIETVGGLLILIGLFTRYAAIVTAVEMVFAWFIAHAPRGWSPLQNGGEPAMLYFAAFLVIATQGARKWGLDLKLKGR